MSLRTRLTLSYTAFFIAALLLLGVGIFVTVKRVLENGVINDLRVGTDQMQAFYRVSLSLGLQTMIVDGELRMQPRGEIAEIFMNRNLIAQVWSSDGQLLGRSPNMNAQILPLPEDVLQGKLAEEWIVSQQVGQTRLRSMITPLVAGRLEGGRFVDAQLVGFLQVSRPTSDVETTLGVLLSLLLGGGAVALLITAGGVAWLSRAALAPIDQVTRTAQSIVHAEDLQQRVPVPDSQDELQRLTITINDMLGRMEGLFTAQRRFVTDVSHELRTPLAAMQGNLEVLSRGAACQSPEVLHESLADMRRETARLTRMVNDLLLLAQSEAGVQIRREPVELDTLLLEVHRELRPLSGTVQLRIGHLDQLNVTGDRDRLKQALLNLGVNAIQHTPAGGRVTLSLDQHEHFICLSVADTGVGIAAEDLPHIFDRFYRADRSRSRHNGGAGLGLSIVKRIIAAHAGHVTVASEVGRGSTFAIWLPQSAQAALPEPAPFQA
jgi:two-component system, OmpR family, sensor kinase